MNSIVSVILGTFLTCTVVCGDTLTVLPIDQLFAVPSQDELLVEAVVAGHFPDDCHSLHALNAVVSVDRKTIRLTTKARVRDGVCNAKRMAFTKAITLSPIDGRTIPAGEYTLTDGMTLGKIRIARATTPAPSPETLEEERKYAKISHVSYDPVSGESTLTGSFPSGCVSLDSVHVVTYTNTVAVLPRFAVREAAECGGPRAFQHRVTMPRSLPRMPFLLHVRYRTQTLNQVISVP